MLNFDTDVIGISPVPRHYTAPGSGPVRIVVIHTDQRQARNSRILASLPQPVQDIITSERWDSIPAPEAIICTHDKSAPVNVEFQAERGGTPPNVELLTAVNNDLIRDDNVSKHGILLYLPGTVTVPPNTQILVDTRIRLRFPEGVSGSYWNLTSAATGKGGYCVPIGCSYNGTIAITIANANEKPLTVNHNDPAAIVVINVADAELSLQSSQDIFTDNSARQFKKR